MPPSSETSELYINSSIPQFWHSADLIYNYSDWHAADKSKFLDWCRSYVEYDIAPNYECHNWGSWWLFNRISAAYLLEDSTLFKSCVARYKKMIYCQISPIDGHMSAEAARGAKGMIYHCHSIEPLSYTAEVGTRAGENLFIFDTLKSGTPVSLSKAVNFVNPYILSDTVAWVRNVGYCAMNWPFSPGYARIPGSYNAKVWELLSLRMPDTMTLIISDSAPHLTNYLHNNPDSMTHPMVALNLTHHYLELLHGDDDGDGMPNNFETHYGLDKDNPADTSDDNDGDGISNIQEYRNRTNAGIKAGTRKENVVSGQGHSLITCKPNPFNPVVEISFGNSLKSNQAIKTSVEIFDSNGRRVYRAVSNAEHHLIWNGDMMPSGVYFVRLISGSITVAHQRIVLVR